jgi:toxin-antitoxin system PIN domain toxin
VILPDVNILVHAHNTDSRRHGQARRWWSETMSATELVALPWAVILGFIRITTNRTIFESPWHVEDALERVETWLQQPHVRVVHPTHRHAELLAAFLRGAGTAGNLTTDAHLAALALEHGCTLVSTDADFGRFPGLRWHNPLAL